MGTWVLTSSPLANSFLNIMLLPDPGRQDQGMASRWRAWYMGDSTLFHASFFAQLARMSTVETEFKPIHRTGLSGAFAKKDSQRSWNSGPSSTTSDGVGRHLIPASIELIK